MLFRRRQPETLSSRLRTLLWPRRSFSRSFQYFKKRVLRLNATPHAIAAGFAAGVMASCTPFIGFHFLLAFTVAYLIAGNMAAAALGTVLGNPLTFPFIWGITYEIGQYLLRSGTVGDQSPERLGEALSHMNFTAIWAPIVKPMLIGAIPLGLGAGVCSYVLVYLTARSFQKHRARRIETRRLQRRDARTRPVRVAPDRVSEEHRSRRSRSNAASDEV